MEMSGKYSQKIHHYLYEEDKLEDGMVDTHPDDPLFKNDYVTI